MRIHPLDPELYLVELTDFREDPLPDLVQRDLGPLSQIVAWAGSYLSQPHPELGRSGPVCPFTRPAMNKNTFFLTVCRGADLTREEVSTVVMKYRDWFLEMEPLDLRGAQYKTINILFPDIPQETAIDLIEDTQELLKTEYVPYGIMVGEFHAGPPKKAGLWNPHFRPLSSPVPLLSIRHMVPTDFAFLRDRKDYMTSYLTRFSDKFPAPMRDEIEATARGFGLEGLLPGADAAIP